jgi:hypothetical protein
MGTTDTPNHRGVRRLLWLAVFLLALGAVLSLWHVGAHRHVLEVKTAAGTVRIISKRSPFRVSLPGVHDVQAISLLGYDGFRRAGSTIVPMQVDGVGIL